MKILGIESSHDDTSIAIIENKKVLINLKISQINIHKQYGGTIPEIASREHFNNFMILLEELKSKADLNEIDYVAYTETPGLIGALQMGKLFSHAISKSLNKPLIPINHLDGHIFSVLLNKEDKIKYPAIALVISGGHTNLYYLENDKDKQLIGNTLDDAAGEVFDKVAWSLFKEFPGGKLIDDIFSQNQNTDFSKYKFSNPKLTNKFDFSFSGYKTQVINLVKNTESIDKNLIATSFQKHIIDFIITKVQLAINEYKPNSVILSGGVSANKYLRKQFYKLHENVLMPLFEYSTDNGAMIAIAAFEKLSSK